MRLREWDWDKQGFVELDYPDAVIAEFVNRFRTTKAWEDDPRRVTRWVRALDQRLSEHRQELAQARAATAALVTAPPAPPKPPVVRPKGGRRAAHAEG